MTVKDLLEIVCECLGEVGITPELDDMECEEWGPAELALDDRTLVKLIACIKTKVKARKQTVVIGKTMWRKSASVREFCEALSENLE